MNKVFEDPTFHIRSPAERQIVEAAAELLGYRVVDSIDEIDGYVIAVFVFNRQKILILNTSCLHPNDLSVPCTPEEVVAQLVGIALK